MAKIYGSGGGYLIKNNIKFYFLAFYIPLGVLVLFLAVLKYFPRDASLLILVLVAIAVVKEFEPLFKYFKKKSVQFFNGWGGELDIRRELQKLPDEFSIFQNLLLGKDRGNIDFVVLGPGGVYILEVKSHKGHVGFDGQNLTLNGRPFPGHDPIRQVHGQMWALKNYLKEKLGQDIYINSVLVFSSSYAKMRFGFQPIKGVTVIQKNFLKELFDRPGRGNLPKEEIELVLKQVIAGKN